MSRALEIAVSWGSRGWRLFTHGVQGIGDFSPLVSFGVERYPSGSRLFTSGVQGARDYSTLVSGGLEIAYPWFPEGLRFFTPIVQGALD